jgi:hypothetical protein
VLEIDDGVLFMSGWLGGTWAGRWSTFSSWSVKFGVGRVRVCSSSSDRSHGPLSSRLII